MWGGNLAKGGGGDSNMYHLIRGDTGKMIWGGGSSLDTEEGVAMKGNLADSWSGLIPS